MEMARARLRRAAVLAAFVAVSFLLGSPAVFGVKTPPQETLERRADIIRIDSMRVFGKLTRPTVPYLHQKHTEALKKKNQDCSACHLSQDNRLSTKFMRLQDTTKEQVMDIYHTNCISCHKETTANKEKSGPLVCGECHKDNAGVLSSWRPIGMDKSLHYRHTLAQADKCENCHHVYNAATKKLYYAKGKEGTCRYCHHLTTEDNRISMRQASHLECVGCHRQTLAKNESAGPITCDGCHDAGQQKLIEKLTDVPRMKANQPDFVFIKTIKDNGKTINPAIHMNLVPFNHKAHETYNDTCRVCHHAELQSCVDCHTLDGSKEGGFVELSQAMHRPTAEQSCIGCHESKQTDQSCAGCHTSFERKRQQGTAACLNCHMVPTSKVADAVQRDEEKMETAQALENRQSVADTYNIEDIPQTVTIQTLMNKYEAVKLPHRKIFQAMVNKINTNKLANYFHYENGTVCQGCHHNSPATKTPPKCGSCHGRPFNEKDPFKPGLMAAYHRQCMECHKAMGINKPVSTDCTACHAKKS
jgi:hypothetical protein